MLAAGEPRLGNSCNDWIQGATRAIGLPSTVVPPFVCQNVTLISLYDKLKAWDRPPSANVAQAATKFCLENGFCNATLVSPPGWPWFDAETRSRDPLPSGLRVAKVQGKLGQKYKNNAVRVSVVSECGDKPGDPRSPCDRTGFADDADDPTAYAERFRVRWKNFFLESKIVDLSAESGTGTLEIDPKSGKKTTVSLSVPKEDDGVRGVFFGDPCIPPSGDNRVFANCGNGKLYKIKERLPEILNLAGADDTISHWGFLGDNFYDVQGLLSETFYLSLDQSILQKIFLTTPGNHDFWVIGTPFLSSLMHTVDKLHPIIQYGYGFMQYFAQDTLASLNPDPGSSDETLNGNFFNFTVNEGDARYGLWQPQLASRDNFLFYNRIGKCVPCPTAPPHSPAPSPCPLV